MQVQWVQYTQKWGTLGGIQYPPQHPPPHPKKWYNKNTDPSYEKIRSTKVPSLASQDWKDMHFN